jgi:hypothetical protein
VLLISFSYGELWSNFFIAGSVGFKEKLTELLNSPFTLLSNAGLIAIMFLDSYITKAITKNNTQQEHEIAAIIVISFIAVIFLKMFAEIKGGLENYLCWLFLFFLGCLFYYKSKSLNIKHSSSVIT